MINYGRLNESFMPHFHPPRKFVEYSIASSNEFESGKKNNQIFVGFNVKSKKSRSTKNVAIYDISQIISTNKDGIIPEKQDKLFSAVDFLFQKVGMTPQEILNIFSEGIDNILDPQTVNEDELYFPSNNLQNLKELSTNIATSALNSISSSLSLNSSKQNSSIKLINDSYYMISKKLKLYIVNSFLKNELSNIEKVSEIGQLYKIYQTKVKSIKSSFSPLCLSKLNLNIDFEDIAQQTINDVFSGKKTINNCEKNIEFYENDKEAYNSTNNSGSFEFNDSNGFGNGYDMKEQEDETNENEDDNDENFSFDVDFDGQELFQKVSTLIIQYFIENAIWRKNGSSSLSIQDSSNKCDESDLTAFYYNINNSGNCDNQNNQVKSDVENSIANDYDFISAFEFIKKTGNLYETTFIQNLINSIIDEYTPIVTQFFEKCQIEEENLSSSQSSMKNLTSYFNDIKQIETELNENLENISFMLPKHSIDQINEAFRELVFASKLDEICKSGLRILVQKKDIKTIELCAEYAKSTNKIQKFAHELSFDLESVVGDCFKAQIQTEKVDSNPIRDAIDYMNMMNQLLTSSFKHPSMKEMLKNAFKKGLNSLPDQAARLLAEEVNFQFLHLPSYNSKLKSKTRNETKEHNQVDQDEGDHRTENEGNIVQNDARKVENKCLENLSFINELIGLFRYLTCKDVFEAYYHLYLSRRVFMLKASVIQADEFFSNLLRKICGPEYTKRIDIIFEDLHKSSRALYEFQEEGKKREIIAPSYFKVLVLSQSSWITNVDDIHQTPIDVPVGVREVLSDFAQFYLLQNPKKRLEWNHHFSRVKLSICNPGFIKEIQCNGIAATIFCLFNDHKILTKKEIIDLCKGSEKIIDECIKVLKSKKNGKILKSLKAPSKSGYVIDLESELATNAANSSGVVKMPFLKMILPRSQTENAIMHLTANRAHSIDANVMLVLKRDHSMDKEQLKETIKEMIQFRLDDDLFETELQNLSQKLYLRLDPSGRVHYLP